MTPSPHPAEAQEREAFEPTMDIYARPGTKVRFHAAGGYPGEQKSAIEAGFVVGNLYTVRRCDVDHSRTSVLFEEIPGAWNSCLFGPAARASHAPAAASGEAATLQGRVQPWLMECFGPMIAGDREERNHRFLEEALELVQACGCSASEAHQLVDYVFGRPVGEKDQEVGGVMITLAALCLANGLDMHDAGERELARIWTMVEKIRAKQAAKPKHSPLPALAKANPAAAESAHAEWERGELWHSLAKANGTNAYLVRDIVLGYLEATAPAQPKANPAAGAEPDSEDEAPDQWRSLALQFDGHRMQALGHLRMLLSAPTQHADAVRAFLSAPPLDGETVLNERIWKLAANEREALVEAARELTPATSERDAEDAADMFWDDSDPERMAHSIHEIVEERDGDCGLEVGQEITIQCAKRMPNVTVRVTKIRDEDGGGEVDYETIDAQREQSEKRSGEGGK